MIPQETPESILTFGRYEFIIRHCHTLGWEVAAKNEVWEPGGAIIIQTGDREFYIAGSGFVITFRNKDQPGQKVGILKNEEGRFENNEWKIIRHLNGDQTHQGRHCRIFLGDYSNQRLVVYDY